MDTGASQRLELFKNTVGTKFQLYNSLFTALPFHKIEKTGILLSLFLNYCEECYAKGWSPIQIVDSFFEKYTSYINKQEGLDLLFRFVQYAERQVVLFDAVEDAAFEEVHDLNGAGTINQLASEINDRDIEDKLMQKLEAFAITLVLTAHPTQFYPGSVLGIINDLSKALKVNDTVLVNTYLQQLGKTPLFKKQKPTPYDEAVSLIWYLENVFYTAIGEVLTEMKERFPAIDLKRNPLIRMGFWPGGDRDGNPNVTADITLKVADAMHDSIIRCYYNEVRWLKRRLTFKGVDTILADLEDLLYRYTFEASNEKLLTADILLQPLQEIHSILLNEHNSLFLPLVENLINKIDVFGIHFAMLDIRQDSGVHGQVFDAILKKANDIEDYSGQPEEEKRQLLSTLAGVVNPDDHNGVVKDTLLSIDAIRAIQSKNGESGCHRYIISHCERAVNVLEVYSLCLLRGWKKEDIRLDIVPLFETVEDLKNAPAIMEGLYNDPDYRAHLARRGMKQVIMVGFSDGTKDGGYLMGNWSIYQAKEQLTKVSIQHGVRVVFFDGRGGPPARGGGKTHKYYASMGRNISTEEIQLTIQGQTVSANFGTVTSAKFNIEQLLHAGITNQLFSSSVSSLQAEHQEALHELAELSFQAYTTLKEDPYFLDYLQDVSPLLYYSETNISSRPAKRNADKRLSLDDLRAIPFVGAWSQLKQNIPGYYGLGSALAEMEAKGKLDLIKAIYERSTYFRTLIDNCEMAMKKSYFPLTAYLADDKKYSALWKMIASEFERTVVYLEKLTGKHGLMADYPVDALSIEMRERIVMPLTTIQQYALATIRNNEALADEDKQRFEKLVIRTAFGIINAGRNSV